MQAGEAADVADREQLQQAFKPHAQALGQTRRRLQPVNPLCYPPTAQAIDATYRQLEQDALIQQVTVTHLAGSPLVDQRAVLVTATAFGEGASLRFELNQQGVVSGLAAGDNFVAWPESSNINRMHGGSREWGLVGLATANLPTSLTVNSLFPQSPR